MAWLGRISRPISAPANKDWQASGKESPEDLAAAFDAYADAVIPAMAGHWTS